MADSFVYWVGMNTPADADAASLAEFNDFYNSTHVGEVIARHGFARATRYELLDGDARFGAGPRWLAVYEMGDESVARGYIERNGGPPPGRPPYSKGPRIWQQAHIAWRVIWQPVSVRGTLGEPPYGIFAVGMDVPDGTSAAALAEFNTFYSSVHVPEVMHWGSFARALRYRQYRSFGYTDGNAPQFCAAYEADQSATDTRRDRPRPAWSKGPSAWENHITRWRLWYRRLQI